MLKFFHFGSSGVAHKLHGLVHSAEQVSHCSYLALVSIGHADYHLAAAVMLATTLIGGALHFFITLSGGTE